MAQLCNVSGIFSSVFFSQREKQRKSAGGHQHTHQKASKWLHVVSEGAEFWERW